MTRPFSQKSNPLQPVCIVKASTLMPTTGWGAV
eukprot:CAMPEP_0206618082 /NCGR_PEP_ID=MMETSP0325_2-20121206/60016_1 /ASSEMBLY_ACC=CAM_ASM_000347 /TAXON_ID=2866 /ORGANISM="Crypthecodinium cohnii, Strain Seligo" /LENGTH=32 /DNA_ID= /DNA_START= /DNA_END= /DNA_ORIENTATION=